MAARQLPNWLTVCKTVGEDRFKSTYSSFQFQFWSLLGRGTGAIDVWVSRAFSWPRWTLAICRLPSLKRHGCHLGLIQNVCLKRSAGEKSHNPKSPSVLFHET